MSAHGLLTVKTLLKDDGQWRIAAQLLNNFYHFEPTAAATSAYRASCGIFCKTWHSRHGRTESEPRNTRLTSRD
jgi:hypothetical protein